MRRTREQCNAYDREYRKRTWDIRGPKQRENSRKLAHKQRIEKYKYLLKHPCIDCGEKDPIVLEFDHRDSEDKKYAIGIYTTLPFKTLLKEIEKCDVRCANCHRRKTAKQYKWKLLEIQKTIRV